MCLVLFVGSGRSMSLAVLMATGALDAATAMPWAQNTIDNLRYILLGKAGVKFAEGSTSEVRRTSAASHVNYGAHSDWIRELMDKFPEANGEGLLVNFMRTFEAIAGISGLNAFRALHITLWLFIAYRARVEIPRSSLIGICGPNVKKLRDMCEAAGVTLEGLYDAVTAIIPGIDPAAFEIWSCKFVNFLYILHCHKQSSLVWRSTLKGPEDKPQRLTGKRSLD